ncbi:hypothetical protein KDN24_23640 [Bacillus sp. Bva_UNVM-123]|uniref:hypothetical protein n=1 Tax=Bacillus sp. Bva_UNVM-123 TaxID=2829798 RepID=UPI00391F9BEE
MKKEWDILKEAQGCLLIGIYSNRFTILQKNKDLLLLSTEPIIEIRKPNSAEEKYWKLESVEDDLGDDLLIFKEQETPDPLDYKLIDHPYQKHIVMGSSFLVHKDKLIKKVKGYGFMDNQSEYLVSIVLELENVFISITATPGSLIDIKITDEEPNDERFHNLIALTSP